MKALKTHLKNTLSSVSEHLQQRHLDKLYKQHFQNQYYLDNHNIDLQGLSPAEHYRTLGWQAGLDPCDWFSTNDYLDNYTDIKAAQINPFLHYLRHGHAEGRTTAGQAPSIQTSIEQRIRLLITNRKRQAKASTYQDWIKQKEPELQQTVQAALPTCRYRPTISICMAAYNTPGNFLTLAILSVMEQHYANWELCIANDASTDKHTEKLLDNFAKQDRRIKVIHRRENGHIAAATNSALSLATGEYVAFMDHDDLLCSCALSAVAVALNSSPTNNPLRIRSKHNTTQFNFDFLYSDEDIIDANGTRLTPHFKSSWNPALLLCHNYITHLSVIRRTKLLALGGLREGYEGAQDYDLMLRIAASTAAENIGHIPLILYHWRAHDESTAATANNKKYTHDAGIKALESWAELNHHSALVESTQRANFYRVRYTQSKEPHIAIVVPTKDNFRLLKACIDSVLQKTHYKNYHLYIIDNQSVEDDTLNYLSTIVQKPHVSVLQHNKAFNYAQLHNEAIALINQQRAPDLLCFLNNDTEVITSDWLCEMSALAMQDNHGCIGAKLLYPDHTVQHAGVILGLGGYAAHSHRGQAAEAPGYFNRACLTQNLSAVTAACLVVKNTIYTEVGGMEEDFQIAYNDVDFCLKVHNAGYQNIYTPHALLLHHESKTRGNDNVSPERVKRFNEEKALLRKKWARMLDDDPYYSPHLTRSAEDFSL